MKAVSVFRGTCLRIMLAGSRGGVNGLSALSGGNLGDLSDVWPSRPPICAQSLPRAALRKSMRVLALRGSRRSLARAYFTPTSGSTIDTAMSTMTIHSRISIRLAAASLESLSYRLSRVRSLRSIASSRSVRWKRRTARR